MKTRDKAVVYIVAVFSLILSFVLIILAKSLENITVDGAFELRKIFSESIASISFWVLNVTIALATVLFFYWAFLLKKTKLLTTDDYCKRLDAYNGYVKLKGKDFVDFIKLENKERRINAYKEHIERKIERVEKRISTLNYLQLKHNKDEKLERRINYLKSKITDEYIATHQVWWKFNAVSPNDFRFNSVGGSDVYDRTSSMEGIKVSTELVKKVVVSLIISTISLSFITSLVINFNFNAGFWITLLTVIITLAMNYYLGNVFANNIYNNEHIGILDNRIALLKKYFNTTKENLKEPTYADKILEAYEKNLELKDNLTSMLNKIENKQGG